MKDSNPISASVLGGIPETMLITLWAKAVETKNKNPILKDIKSIEIIEKIDYDFKKFKNTKFSQIGVCTRAKLIDEETKSFLAENPDAVVIQLGAGLDTRYERLDFPSLTHWYDLDLPEVIDLRQQLIVPTEKNTYIPLSLFDYQWIEKVKVHKKLVLIIVEGVLMYFSEKEVKDFFSEICRQFDKVTILFDMLFYKGVGQAKKHDAVKKTSKKPEFKWSLYNSKDMEHWNKKIHLTKEYYMSDFYPKRLSIFLKLLYKIPWIYKNLNQRVVKLEIK